MDIIAPTKERLAKHPEWDTPASDKKTKRAYHRQASIIDRMCEGGWVTAEQRSAFERFERDLLKAEKVHVGMCNYGRPMYTVDDGPWDALDIKADAVNRVREAVSAIGHPPEIRALALAILSDRTLAKIGYEIDGERNEGRAITAARKLLQSGTYRLAVHYQFLKGP
jgi:hypothetical protein